MRQKLKDVLDWRTRRDGELMTAQIVAEATDQTYDYDVSLITTGEIVRASRMTSGERYTVGEIVSVCDMGATHQVEGGGYLIMGRPPFAMRNQDAPVAELQDSFPPEIDSVRLFQSCVTDVINIIVKGRNLATLTMPVTTPPLGAPWYATLNPEGTELNLEYDPLPRSTRVVFEWPRQSWTMDIPVCPGRVLQMGFSSLNRGISGGTGTGFQFTAGQWPTAQVVAGDLAVLMLAFTDGSDHLGEPRNKNVTLDTTGWTKLRDDAHSIAAPSNLILRTMLYVKVLATGEAAPGVTLSAALPTTPQFLSVATFRSLTGLSDYFPFSSVSSAIPNPEYVFTSPWLVTTEDEIATSTYASAFLITRRITIGPNDYYKVQAEDYTGDLLPVSGSGAPGLGTDQDLAEFSGAPGVKVFGFSLLNYRTGGVHTGDGAPHILAGYVMRLR